MASSNSSSDTASNESHPEENSSNAEDREREFNNTRDSPLRVLYRTAARWIVPIFAMVGGTHGFYWIYTRLFEEEPIEITVTRRPWMF